MSPRWSQRDADKYAPREPSVRRVPLSTGLAYEVLEWDAESDHTVVLLHGFLDFARSWQPVVEAGPLTGMHLIAPDLRGHGRSDRVGPGGYYHFPDYLADLRSLIQELGRARVSLVGHSMGGSIASYYAGSFPSTIFRMALLEGLGPPEDDSELPSRIAAWVGAWHRQAKARPKRYADIAAAAARLIAQDERLDPELAHWLASHGTEPAPEGDGVQFLHDPLHLTTGPAPFRVESAASFWRRIQAEVLLVEATESVFRHAPEEAARRRAYLPPHRLELIPDAGHLMLRHQPEALGRLLQDFLGRHDP
ncbi:MAG: alpha/beta hydrolase [Polyangiaceae bacterium]|nr:alpha/beta hydrolase [Polyangiaceae bacterium]MCW5791483.1 alpha/beta hydrolase [Polyangiaceae bacterium]